MNAPLARAPLTDFLNLDAELLCIACTKVLTDTTERLGHGGFLEAPECSFLRAEFYNRAGINNWTPESDREAVRRLRIWFGLTGRFDWGGER